MQILTPAESDTRGLLLIRILLIRTAAGWPLWLSDMWTRPHPLRPGDSPGAGAGPSQQDLHHQPRPHPPQVRDEPRSGPGSQEQMGCK